MSKTIFNYCCHWILDPAADEVVKAASKEEAKRQYWAHLAQVNEGCPPSWQDIHVTPSLGTRYTELTGQIRSNEGRIQNLLAQRILLLREVTERLSVETQPEVVEHLHTILAHRQEMVDEKVEPALEEALLKRGLFNEQLQELFREMAIAVIKMEETNETL